MCRVRPLPLKSLLSIHAGIDKSCESEKMNFLRVCATAFTAHAVFNVVVFGAIVITYQEKGKKQWNLEITSRP